MKQSQQTNEQMRSGKTLFKQTGELKYYKYIRKANNQANTRGKHIKTQTNQDNKEEASGTIGTNMSKMSAHNKQKSF